MRDDLFVKLPTPTTLLLLSTIFDSTAAHVFDGVPRRIPALPTKTHHALDVVPFPLLPSCPPPSSCDLHRRGQYNTICGYISGNPQLAATCTPGSYCVLDTAHGAVGCCPDGAPTCTTGVFTGCVDGNSPAQTEVDPYVYTCQGGSVCYRNVFEGGYYQYGCGSASSEAATVLPSATGVPTPLNLLSMSVSFSRSPSPLSATATRSSEFTTDTSSNSVSTSRFSSATNSAPATSATATSAKTTSASITIATTTSPATTASSRSATSSAPSTPTTSSTSSTSSSSSSSSVTSTTSDSSSSSSSQTESSTSFSTLPATNATDAPPTTGKHHASSHTAAIIGGTIGGAALLLSAILATFYFIRRRQRANEMMATGFDPSSNTDYMTPTQGGGGNDPWASQPLQQSYEVWDTRQAPAPAVVPYSDQPAWWWAQPGYAHAIGDPDERPMAVAGARAARGLDGEEDQVHGDTVPLTREIDEFSRGFRDALGRIDDDPYLPGAGAGGVGMARTACQGPMEDIGDRPLWQQNRRLSRNMMWM